MQGDIEFGTDGWRAPVAEMTDERVRWVAQGIATYLRAENAGDAVAIGYDAREHSLGIAQDLSRVLCANGFDVRLPERDAPTPVIGWTVREADLAGGLMVTASHNPPAYNGIKFLPAGGTPALPEATAAVTEALGAPDPLPEDEWGTVTETDLVGPYLDHALSFVDGDLSELVVAYDAMHGSGRGVTDDLLERAGATVHRLRCDPDPEFGGVPPEPVPERARGLVETVDRGAADVGFINDGDADRVGVVTPEAGFVPPSRLLAVLYDAMLEDRSGDVVRSVSTSSLVDRVAAAHGHAVHETPVGFKWVAQAMGEHDALLGGEESGGYGVGAHLRNKDGVLVALVLAAASTGESLDDRLARLEREHGPVHQDRRSVECPDDRKQAVLDALEDDLPDRVAGEPVASVSTVDGFKLTLEDGAWVLVRPSGTEPKLRIYAEGTDPDRVDALLDAGEALLDTHL